MTNSYNLSQTPHKIIILHGLNNHAHAFDDLRRELQQRGFQTEQVILPCHGDHRNEAQDFKTAFQIFEERYTPLTNTPYFVIAFSTGAMYLQLWMQKHPNRLPKAQVLLAPALYINYQNILSQLTEIIPKNFFIKSFSPKEFRRYQTMHIWEYRILIDGINEYMKTHQQFPIKTLVMIDPKDELVSAHKLEMAIKSENNPLVEFKKLPRPYLRKCIGQHHILFHPEYFNSDDWEKILNSIINFFRNHRGNLIKSS